MSSDFTYDEFIKYRQVSRETFNRLQDYVTLLKKWQKAINLIADSSMANIWERHILDSAQVAHHLAADDATIDLGSGAGLPGMIISILGIKNITLVESDQRKVAFLKEAARVTRTDVTIRENRVEDIDIARYTVITSRGFASLKATLDMFKDALGVKHKLLLLKGKSYKSDIREAQAGWSFDYTAYPSVTDSQGVLLSIQNPKPQEAI